MEAPETFDYSPWRHGGWYVHDVRYPSGAVGCVSRNLVNPATGKPDRKWRIVCDERHGDHTYQTRDDAARAEWYLVRAMERPRHQTAETARAVHAAAGRFGIGGSGKPWGS